MSIRIHPIILEDNDGIIIVRGNCFYRFHCENCLQAGGEIRTCQGIFFLFQYIEAMSTSDNRPTYQWYLLSLMYVYLQVNPCKSTSIMKGGQNIFCSNLYLIIMRFLIIMLFVIVCIINWIHMTLQNEISKLTSILFCTRKKRDSTTHFKCLHYILYLIELEWYFSMAREKRMIIYHSSFPIMSW